jgi:glycosyltransferase involved in cell wall biosynthesis
LRICIIGKFPPIQGGVSMRTYRTAHALAARGHEVHVVTNALEARAPFRMYMRDVDWESCAAEPGADSGCVRVHWTDPVDRSQHYIPMASPFVTKLVSLAVAAHDEAPFDVIMSYYMQPYGIAAHLAAEITGAPHVARMAGSDAGRLWHLAQFEPLYDHVLRSANTLIAVGEVAERARERGVDPARIRADFGFTLDAEQFSPDGPALDEGEIVRAAREDDAYADLVWGALPEGAACFGVYGKLGAKKGSFELLEAIARLKRSGREAGLLAMAHGRPHVETAFRDHAAELGIADRVLQIPFLPHWRVPEFLRRCLAVCCLEQNFPIHFHAPIVAREVMLSGACLVGSTEILRKLPAPDSVVDGFNCVAIDDVTDVAALTDRLARIVDDPAPAAALGARGRALIAGMQANTPFPGPVEAILDEAASGRRRATVADRFAPRSRAASTPASPIFIRSLAPLTSTSPSRRHGAATAPKDNRPIPCSASRSPDGRSPRASSTPRRRPARAASPWWRSISTCAASSRPRLPPGFRPSPATGRAS